MTFHRVALQLAQRENVYLGYNGYEEPSLWVGLRAVAKFSWNRLIVRLSGEPGADRRWEFLEPARYEEWADAMRSAVEQAAEPGAAPLHARDEPSQGDEQ